MESCCLQNLAKPNSKLVEHRGLVLVRSIKAQFKAGSGKQDLLLCRLVPEVRLRRQGLLQSLCTWLSILMLLVAGHTRISAVSYQYQGSSVQQTLKKVPNKHKRYFEEMGREGNRDCGLGLHSAGRGVFCVFQREKGLSWELCLAARRELGEGRDTGHHALDRNGSGNHECVVQKICRGS